MFTKYYTLKDPNRLPPPPAKFIDPYYNMSFFPSQGSHPLLNDTLSSFASTTLEALIKTHEAHSADPYPLAVMPTTDYHELIIASFIETSSTQILKDYFTITTTSPSFSQVKAFAKTAAREAFFNLINFTSPFNRESRIQICLSCPLHKSRAKVSPFINAISNTITSTSTSTPTPDSQLGICDMCGCGLKAKTKYKLESVIGALHPNQLKRFFAIFPTQEAFSKCWILKEAVESPTMLPILKGKLRHTNQEALLNEFITTNAVKSTENS